MLHNALSFSHTFSAIISMKYDEILVEKNPLYIYIIYICYNIIYIMYIYIYIIYIQYNIV